MSSDNGETASWSELRAHAPDLAAGIRARFEANPHHVLATIRSDGAPRLSGTEVSFRDGRLTLGVMAGSRKLEDIRRDPRVELHSAPLEEDLGSPASSGSRGTSWSSPSGDRRSG